MKRSHIRRQGRPIRKANWPQAVADAFFWLVSIVLATVFRFEFRLDGIAVIGITSLALATLVTWFALSPIFGIYSGVFRLGSFEELKRLTGGLFFMTLGLGVPVLLIGGAWEIPRSILFIAAPIFLLISGGARLSIRSRDQSRRRKANTVAPAMVYGAGVVAESLIPQLLRDPQSPYLPVALIDDAPHLDGFWIGDVRVEGTWGDLAAIVRKHGAEVVIVAIPSAGARQLRSIYADARNLGLRIIVVPTLRQFLSGNAVVDQLKDVTIEDLIGRETVNLDKNLVGQLVAGQTVLVTGAGGSIGLELAEQLAGYAPERLILADRDESALLAASTRIQRTPHGSAAKRYLVDIRDSDAVIELFTSQNPTVVFHAAALKHVNILEKFPREAWKTNVEGTLNVLESARRTGVAVFVNVSTDKAANPANVLGRSKRLAEELTAWFAQETGLKYVSVRFGNVLGSRGSLIPILAEQISSGGPLTITDKDATRYFMSIPEACQLVLQAAAEGEAGDVLVLDMGEPVRIQEIAERMIELSGRSVEIVYTGLRPGEKLHEDLLSDSETPIPSSHPKIMRIKATPRSPEEVLAEKW
jgi:FlaA1/EpsC-like NDP-sugar epimerase